MPDADANPFKALTLEVRLVTTSDGFADLRAAWADLWPRAHLANTFLSFEWLNAWWECYRPPHRLCLVVAEEGGRLLGVAPLMSRVEKRLFLPCRVIRFLGDGTHETDHANFVVDGSRRAEVMSALLEAIERLPWDLLCLDQILERSENTAQAIAHARGRGCLVESVVSGCPVRLLESSPDAMLKSMQPRFRTTLRSTRRKLEEKYRVQFGRYEDPGGFPAALETLFRIHASRWAAKGKTGVFTSDAKRAFYRRLTDALHARGWLRFYYLSLDGITVAQEYCFEAEGTVYLLQEGFDYAYSQENLGNALRSYVMESLIASGARAYDFLAGTSRHKELWSNARENDLVLEIARARPWARLCFRLPRAWEAAKAAVRPHLSRMRPGHAGRGAAPERDSRAAGRGHALPIPEEV